MKTQDATSLLKAAFEDLGYSKSEGVGFFNAMDKPGDLAEEIWVEKGEWLALAHEVGACNLFFLDNNPVVVFAKVDGGDAEALRELYNRVWCMARPRLLFLAKPGELAVYDLARKPPGTSREFSRLRPFELARSTADVAEKLKHFRREAMESGRVFEAEYRFGDLKNRADKALIRDLKQVRGELVKAGLGGEKLKYAHALIGRSIFIRYLEDRKILDEKTYWDAAKGDDRWRRILENPTPRPGLDFSETPSLYLRALENKGFTFALFRKLADDFNGDMFPVVDREESIIEQAHLRLIQNLLFGDVGRQRSLFFYAYQFKIVPLELISSIYEEFYHEENGSGRKQGAYYTPPALVEFVMSRTLTPDRLARAPRVLDPACGSGIFLVDAFRRIVRYRSARQGRRLRYNELRKILRDQVSGVDINAEAVRVAAFSLYLAFLHYLEPPDIREQIAKGNRLPNLVADDANPDSFNTLLVANAFDSDRIDASPHLKKRFSSSRADMIVGNPPWGSPGPRDSDARRQNKMAMDWCAQREAPVGDRERSQAFIWRAMDMLKPGGVAGLLVSTGVFFKHHEKSVAFRREWLDRCKLDAVFNFAHTRKVFFKSAVSPFAMVVFHKEKAKKSNSPVHYWSSRRTRSVEGLQSVVFSRSDIKIIWPEDDLTDYRTWKIFLWGGHRDKSLISFLMRSPSLESLADLNKVGQGYTKANRKIDADWLKQYESLPVNRFCRYGPVDLGALEKTPERVKRRGVREVYHGLRLLVQRGIEEKSSPRGKIIARLEDKAFCFTTAIQGVKLSTSEEWKYGLILGILWSSLARYYFFMTTSNWGLWHHELHLHDELLQLPIRFPENRELKSRIIGIVDELRNYAPEKQDLVNFEGPPGNQMDKKRGELEARLDAAIFELYGLSEAEIDLTHDMCHSNLDFFYLREKSESVKSILSGPLDANHGTSGTFPAGDLGNYLRTFIQCWDAYLDRGTEFHWRLHSPPESDAMLAVVFSVHPIDECPVPGSKDEREAWSRLLRRLDDALVQPVSPRVYIDGLVRAVMDDEILIIRRNEKRFWTRSMAREDAEATLLQAMKRERMEKESDF
ncbi:MAG: N-6 DNA methylase [Desulfobacterales bacterium]|nr:N-6 DNA methylase [Desulfobacterales bacterium]